MPTLRCSICQNKAVRPIIDPRLDEGMSAAALSRYLEAVGLHVSQEVIARHRKHYAEGRDAVAKSKARGRDLAVLVRDKAIEQFEDGDLDLTNKDHAAGIKAGLQAQSILDKREVAKGKNAMAELGRGLLAMLLGEPPPVAPQLEDGNTVEGEFKDVTPDGPAE